MKAAYNAVYEVCPIDMTLWRDFRLSRMRAIHKEAKERRRKADKSDPLRIIDSRRGAAKQHWRKRKAAYSPYS